MKILIVTQYYYPEHFSTTTIAEELVKHGHEVTVLTAKPCYGFDRIPKEYKKINFEVINGVKVHRVHIHERGRSKVSLSLNYLSFNLNAKRHILKIKEKFDVVLAISLSPVISISPAIKYAKRNKVASVLYCEDIWPESVVSAGAIKKNSFIYKILFKWSKSIYSKLDKIIVSSPSFKKYFEEVLGIKNKGFLFVPQPPIENSENAIAHEFKEKHSLVYAGNIGSMQMIDKLVLAMKEIKTEDAKLHLLGDGIELKNIVRLIKENKLENKVIYEGSYPLVRAEEFYKNAKALVVSLNSDTIVGKTIPNKAIQYLKYNKPILGIIGGDGKSLLEKAGGTVFTEPTVESIAKNIDKILSSPNEKLSKMGSLNIEYYKNNLTAEKLVSDIEEELKNAAK